jgi:hypothetical protein
MSQEAHVSGRIRGGMGLSDAKRNGAIDLSHEGFEIAAQDCM